jgi:Astacin (Peptidase family M12A)
MHFLLPDVLLFLCILLSYTTVASSASSGASSTLYTYAEEQKSTSVTISDAQYGVRNVDYYIINGGLAVIDGDVIYGTEAQLLSNVVNGATSNFTRRAFSVKAAAGIWPNATITYKYDSADTASTVSGFFDTAVSRWKSKAPYLQFVRLDDGATESSDVLTVKYTDGCSSYVGLDKSHNQILTLGPGCGANEATHEIGHALGMY